MDEKITLNGFILIILKVKKRKLYFAKKVRYSKL
jgi:hypothetical protein